MDVPGVLKWLGSAVFLAITVNILSNLLSPYVSDWLANSSGKRAQTKVTELSSEEKMVGHLVGSPYELCLWAAYGVLRAAMWFLAALLLLGAGFITVLLSPTLYPSTAKMEQPFFSERLNVVDFFTIGIVAVASMIFSNCLSRLRTVARVVFAVGHHEEYLPALRARKDHYWRRVHKSRW